MYVGRFSTELWTFFNVALSGVCDPILVSKVCRKYSASFPLCNNFFSSLISIQLTIFVDETDSRLVLLDFPDFVSFEFCLKNKNNKYKKYVILFSNSIENIIDPL